MQMKNALVKTQHKNNISAICDCWSQLPNFIGGESPHPWPGLPEPLLRRSIITCSTTSWKSRSGRIFMAEDGKRPRRLLLMISRMSSNPGCWVTAAFVTTRKIRLRFRMWEARSCTHWAPVIVHVSVPYVRTGHCAGCCVQGGQKSKPLPSYQKIVLRRIKAFQWD